MNSLLKDIDMIIDTIYIKNTRVVGSNRSYTIVMNDEMLHRLSHILFNGGSRINPPPKGTDLCMYKGIFFKGDMFMRYDTVMVKGEKW